MGSLDSLLSDLSQWDPDKGAKLHQSGSSVWGWLCREQHRETVLQHQPGLSK